VGDLIDLAVVGRASRALALWWDAYLDGGDVSVTGLDTARRELAMVPAQAGKLGRALALIVDVQGRAPLDAIVDAVALLTRTVAMAGPTASSPPPRGDDSQPGLPLGW
jgi:hypothetical protein